ncbi:MAG: DUF4465 domain-containing protein [Bacteroidota bacterium]
MRKITLNIFMAASVLFLSTGNECKAQTTSDFENLTIPIDSFWNGSDAAGTFISGNACFENKFVDWGGGITSWSGFSYTNLRDSVTQSYTNEFSAITAKGFNASSNYAVAYVSSFDPLPCIKLNAMAQGDTVSGFYVTNSTYSYLSMKNGGGVAKKFGGASGDDPDWFALVAYGYYNGVKKTDSVMFYLADYRFLNNAQDYLVKNWQWVDLTSLGRVDSLLFTVFSSDVGTYGINNPTYFCMDNLITNHNSSLSVQENGVKKYALYPNPAKEVITIFAATDSQKNDVRIFDLWGQTILHFANMALPKAIDISDLKKGVYVVQINEWLQKLVVQ